MFAKFKRAVMMPFIKRKNLKAIKPKSYKEILAKEDMLHEGYIKAQRKENEVLALEYKHKRDALRWVLNKVIEDTAKLAATQGSFRAAYDASDNLLYLGLAKKKGGDDDN